MTAYLLRRLLSLSLSLVAASLVIFLVMEVVPGDPASFMMGMNADPQAVAALRSQLGLDEPLPIRYLGWVAGLLQGDFGVSYTYRVPVSELIAERVVISLPWMSALRLNGRRVLGADGEDEWVLLVMEDLRSGRIER